MTDRPNIILGRNGSHQFYQPHLNVNFIIIFIINVRYITVLRKTIYCNILLIPFISYSVKSVNKYFSMK